MLGGVRARATSWLISGVFLVAGCAQDEGLVRVEGSGFFNPARLEYGTRAVGDAHELVTVLRNSSPGRLLVQDIRFEPPQEVYAAFLTDGGTLRGAQLAPGQSVGITLVYRPLAEGDYDATLVVEAEALEIPLEITARARRVAPARPSLDPGSLRFTGSEVGRNVSRRVRITNAGDTDGALEAVGARSPFTVTAVDGAPLDLPTPRLAPGESVDVEVHFLPRVAAPVEGQVTFRFDTDQRAALPVFGDAVDPGNLTCIPLVVDFGDVPRGQRAVRSVSCDVVGGPYALEAVRMADGSAPYFSVEPRVPTLVEGRLDFDVVLDPLGLEGRHDGIVEIVPAHRVTTRVSATVEVTPPPPGEADLEAELVWNTGNSDFDLHLVRLDGAPFEPGKDCYFEDKHPDWGEPGYRGDDPLLTTDDVNGFGPEKVSLLFAAEPAYDLYVQFYGFESDIPPSTSAQVTYRLRGQAPVALERDLIECGVLWHVGRFTFDAGVGSFSRVDTTSMDYRPRAGASCRP